MIDELKKVLKLLKLAERLKFEMRHGWLSNGDRESVAEHVWRVSLMAMLLSSYLAKKVDMEKTLKMIIIHDLVEAEAGDVPVFDAFNPDVKKQKEEREKEAIEHIRQLLDNPQGQEVYDLWYEFEKRETDEAKFAVALDKLEAQLQHNEADMNTWIEIEKLIVFFKYDPYCAFDPSMVKFKELIQQQAFEKLAAAGHDIEDLRRQASVHVL